VIDGEPCPRCGLPGDPAGPDLCQDCQPLEDATRLLQSALRRLAEDRAEEAVRIIDAALEALRVQ